MSGSCWFQTLLCILLSILLIDGTNAIDLITNIAGSSTSGGFSGDNGLATSVTLYYPWGMSFDTSSSNFYFCDQGNHRLRKITVPTGIISTVAGTGASSFSGDNGAATSAALYNPSSVMLDSSGTHFIVILFMSISFLYHES